MQTLPPIPDLSHNTTALERWRAQKLGMFIHWGLYAIPGGQWDGEEVPGLGEWLMSKKEIPLARYRQLAESFAPDAWDARAVVDLAVAAGMKYVVFTSKHHDGFAMYDSAVSDYCITRGTPWGRKTKRDPLRELSEECARAGLGLGIYYSHDFDWEHPDGGGNTWDYDPKTKDFARYFEEKSLPQVRELLTNYGPVELLWFDMPRDITRAQARQLRDEIKRLQPDCLISGRIGHGMGDYGSMGDNQIPAAPPQGDWEMPGTLSDSWGYKHNEGSWTTSDVLVLRLSELASKGINYLLNIGPDETGAVPPEAVKLLRELGDWTSSHGDAIYGSEPSPFPFDLDWGRITRKSNRLFLHFWQWPAQGKFSLLGLKSTVTAAWLLGGQQVSWQQSDETLSLHLPATAPDAPVSVVELEFADSVEVDTKLQPQADGKLVLPAHLANIENSPQSIGQDYSKNGNALAGVDVDRDAETINDAPPAPDLTRTLHLGRAGLLENWRSPLDRASWTFYLPEAGTFAVRVHTVAPKYKRWQGGHQLRVTVENQVASGVVTADEMVDLPRTYHFEEAVTDLGTLALGAGTHTLTLEALQINPDVAGGLCVGQIVLNNQ